jgi:fructoselysine-6-P-deglycase FrlB-like protein
VSHLPEPANAVPPLGLHMDSELSSQPDCWERAITQAQQEHLLPAPGARVAVVGCGTSWFMAQSYAAAREGSGNGETDAFAASEASVISTRAYDAVVAITRSGTTSEILTLLADLKGKTPTVVVLGDTGSPATALADGVVGLPYADESSVVQTRFATSALVYLLTSAGVDLGTAVADARDAVSAETPAELLNAEQFSFLGTGWTIGLAHEAALKMREGVQGWTESYPAMEYRHGPIAIAQPGRVTWVFGQEPSGLRNEVAATGAAYVSTGAHPLADLVRVHKITLDRARFRKLDPDTPRHLSRSVVLES